MYAEDMFPIGFCEVVQYSLMPPKKYLDAESAKKFGIVMEEVEIEDNVKAENVADISCFSVHEDKENEECVAAEVENSVVQ